MTSGGFLRPTTEWDERRSQENAIDPYTPGRLTTQIHPYGFINEETPEFFIKEKLLSPSLIKRIFSCVEYLPGEKLELGKNLKVRQVRVYPSDIGEDIYDLYSENLAEVNLDFRFHVSGWFESFVYLEYVVGDFNSWHVDSTSTDRTKIGFTTILNTPGKNFEGGEIEILKRGPLPLQKPGDTVIFPGYLAHQVRPVTKGMRKTLTGWLGGPSWQ